MKNYCNKCDREVKDLNNNEKEELKKEGSFVCSNCINEEMENEDYVDLELILKDVEELFNKIKGIILNQNEKSHNWNKNHIANLVFNEWLIFKKNINA